ncbi:MAG TPA: HAD family hydrolase [Gemmatimonadales bacterium]|nr:HAD family hydrolase [Gemmatimonadales bacterium]
MSQPYDVVTFDCYGTLIDWETGISEAFISAAARDGVSLERSAVLQAYAEIEPVVEAETFRPYREVLAETAVRVAGRLGWGMGRARAEFLPHSLPAWRPFADTNPALERLHAAGLRLGILSNVDDDLLAGTRRHFTVPFDLIVTAAQVRSYKPAPGHFVTARERLGNVAWLHAAQSWFHDVNPAAALGIPVAWVNRKSEPAGGGAKPVVEVTTLTELADWLLR